MIKKNHIVQLNMRGADKWHAVVKWLGKDGRGSEYAVIRFDHNGALLLTETSHLRVVIIPLSAEKRIGRETTPCKSTGEK